MDLRERAIARLEAGESVRAVARALSVSPSSVVKWWGRYRRTGSVAPGKVGGHVPPKIAGAQREDPIDVRHRDDPAGRENQEPFDRVAKLPHVAGPVLVLEALDRLRAEDLLPDTGPPSDLGREVGRP